MDKPMGTPEIPTPNHEPFSFTALAMATAICSLLLLILIKGFNQPVENALNSEHIHSTILTTLFVAAVGLLTYRLVHRHDRFEHKPLRIKQDINRLLHQGPDELPDTIWLALAAELAHLALPSHSLLLEAFTDIWHEKEDDKDRRAALTPLLAAIADQIEMRPATRHTHFLDEMAMFSADGDERAEQIRAFEAKRALYHSFATSWPLRIVLILLIFTLGLVGWRTVELADMGKQARQLSEAAAQQISQAEDDLKRSRDELSTLLNIVSDSKETLREARLAAAQAKADLDQAVEDGVRDVNRTTQSSITTLENQLETKSNELQTALISLTGGHTRDINQLGSDKAGEITALAQDKISALNQWEKDTRTQLEKLSKEKAQALDHHTSTQKTKLETHRSLKIRELNTEGDQIADDLHEHEKTAINRIKAVFERVESSEQSKVEAFNQTLSRNKEQINELARQVTNLHNTIQQHKPFATELVNVVNLIEKQGSWAQPGLLASVLEWRSAIVVVALLVALLSMGLSVIAFWKTKG